MYTIIIIIVVVIVIILLEKVNDKYIIISIRHFATEPSQVLCVVPRLVLRLVPQQDS